jgi:hypothetical protein
MEESGRTDALRLALERSTVGQLRVLNRLDALEMVIA